MVVYSVHQQPTAAIVHAEAGTHIKWLCINTGYCQSAAVVNKKEVAAYVMPVRVKIQVIFVLKMLFHQGC